LHRAVIFKYKSPDVKLQGILNCGIITDLCITICYNVQTFKFEGVKVSNYELVYIVSPGVTEEELPTVLDKVSDILKKSGGNITETNQWGRRKLAYPIKKFNEGNYILTKFESETTSVKNIESGLKLSDEILRYLIVKESA